VQGGEWAQSENMIYLEPAGAWEEVEPYRFLKKIILDGDRFLLPSGHNEFMYDQAGYLLELAFFGGTAERRGYHWDKQLYSSLINQGISLELLLSECGATVEELEEMDLLSKIRVNEEMPNQPLQTDASRR